MTDHVISALVSLQYLDKIGIAFFGSQAPPSNNTTAASSGGGLMSLLGGGGEGGGLLGEFLVPYS